MTAAVSSLESPLGRLLRSESHRRRVTHVEHLAARDGTSVSWPAWVAPELIDAMRRSRVEAPWSHQAAAAELAWAGRSVVVATGTASGKSLAYLLPALTCALRGEGTTLYLAPTKALAGDQLRAISELDLSDLRAATYDGDT